jgi:hypothetical protein
MAAKVLLRDLRRNGQKGINILHCDNSDQHRKRPIQQTNFWLLLIGLDRV